MDRKERREFKMLNDKAEKLRQFQMKRERAEKIHQMIKEEKYKYEV